MMGQDTHKNIVRVKQKERGQHERLQLKVSEHNVEKEKRKGRESNYVCQGQNRNVIRPRVAQNVFPL